MSDKLSDDFEVHRSLILSLLDENSFVGDCKIEIIAALDNIKSDLDNHDCADMETSDEISIDDVLNFIHEDDGCSYGLIIDAIKDRGAYCIYAKNLNEQDRIERFIEDLKTNPYAP